MGRFAKVCVALVLGAGLAIPGQTALGDYVISVVDRSTGLSVRNAVPGDTVDLDVVLTGAPTDKHQISQFDVNFSQGGLDFNSYLWDPDTAALDRRFNTGTGDDKTIPNLGALPLSIVAGTPFPTSADIDIRFDNLTTDNPATGTGFDFGSGTVVTLQLGIPADFLAPSGSPVTVNIDGEGVLFRRGFVFVASTPGETFQLNVVPEPATLALLGIGGLVGMMRRRRR